MRNIVYLLIILFSLTACKKGIGIPEEYSFLKGTWYCSECVYDSMRIENHRIVFTSNKLRPNVIYFDEIKITPRTPIQQSWWILFIFNKKVTKHESFIVNSIDENTDTLWCYSKNNTSAYPNIYLKNK